MEEKPSFEELAFLFSQLSDADQRKITRACGILAWADRLPGVLRVIVGDILDAYFWLVDHL